MFTEISLAAFTALGIWLLKYTPNVAVLVLVSTAIAFVKHTSFLYWRTVQRGYGAIMTRYRHPTRVISRESLFPEGLKVPLLDRHVGLIWVKETVDSSEDDAAISVTEDLVFLGARRLRVTGVSVSFDDGHAATVDVTVKYRIVSLSKLYDDCYAPGVNFKHAIEAVAATALSQTSCERYFRDPVSEGSALNARFRVLLLKTAAPGLEITGVDVKTIPPKHLAPILQWEDRTKYMFHAKGTYEDFITLDIENKKRFLAEQISSLEDTRKELEALGVDKSESYKMALVLVNKTLKPYNKWM